MGETSDQIAQHIRETRHDLSENISELEDKVKTAVDWRAQFEERPGTMMAVAFAGGLLLSAILPSMHSSRKQSSDNDWRPPANPDASDNMQTNYDRKPGRASETLGALKGALIGIAANRLTCFINELLPGFEQEFSKAQSGQNADRYRYSFHGQPDWQKPTGSGPN